MKTQRSISTIIVLIITTVLAVAQKNSGRLQPGKLYEAGEKIYAPRYGFHSIIPANWEGTLPRGEEIFLLMPDSIDVGGEIYTFASVKDDIQSLRENWLKGVDMSASIRIKSNEVYVENDLITSKVIAEGQSINRGNSGYAAAKCSPFGLCITCLGIGPSQCYDDIKQAVTAFISQATFTEPSNESPYVDFDWKQFLSGKMIISFTGLEEGSYSGTKDNTFHLCSNGTFTGRVKKKGMMKELNSEYNGKQSGTWTAEGIGENGVLKLNFKKAPPVEIPLNIHDEKITINGERYFAAESDECK